MTFLKIVAFAKLLVLTTASCVFAQANQSADLVVVNAKVATMNDANPTCEAIAVKGDRILAVGKNADIKKLVGDETKTIDAKGKFLMPGFIEGHGHFLRLGESKMMLDLTQAKSWNDIVQQVELAAAVTPPGKWIVGRGWHQDKWNSTPTPNIEGYPTHDKLSKITPNHPVLLTHASGHMDFANAYAMRLANVGAKTENPTGGEILRNEQGAATGVFRERASKLIYSAKYKDQASSKTATSQKDYLTRAVTLASDECAQKGVTSFQDAGLPFGDIEFLHTVVDDKIKPRLWVMVRDSNDNIRRQMKSTRVIGSHNNRLTVRAIKRSIDGALGAHGAWLLQPYSDLPGSRGLNTSSPASVAETAQLAAAFDCQLCVHAIGDRANREVLDIFENQFKLTPQKKDQRWRIEHAQHLHPDDIPRFGKLGVIASMQAVHCTSDAIFVPKRLGHRRSMEGAYVWKSLLKSGAVVTNGTDTPIERVDPIPSFYASVTRRLSPTVTFFPEQCLTREEGLKAYTINNAYAAFEDDLKGSLEPGKLADFVLLSNDLLECKDDEIMNTRVLMTFIGGELVYQNEMQSTTSPETKSSEND
jgi:predicted amidohydrolase YtcJ